MAKSTLETRVRAIELYTSRKKKAGDICEIYDISIRTLRRWIRAYRTCSITELQLKKPGPRAGIKRIPKKVEQRIVGLKQKHHSWGARRIKYQYNLPCHWITVHRVIKSHGYKELITQVRFRSLKHFKRELRKFDRRYNNWRKSQALGWKTPASVYHDKR
jgi:transposase InsO family protein